MKSLKSLALASPLLMSSLLAFPGIAHAAFTVTFQQSGNDVVGNGTGSLDPGDLNLIDATGVNSTFIGPRYASLGFGASDGGRYQGRITGPSAFGSGDFVFGATGVSGGFAGIQVAADQSTPFSFLFVPSGIAGASFSNSVRYADQTLASLGLAIGTYTYEIGGGEMRDTYTIVVSDVPAAVPEPLTWAMMVGGFGLVGAAMRRRLTVRYA